MPDTKTPALEWVHFGGQFGAPTGIYGADSAHTDGLPEGFERVYFITERWRVINLAFGEGSAEPSPEVSVRCVLMSPNATGTAEGCECDDPEDSTRDLCDACIEWAAKWEDISIFRDTEDARIELRMDAPDFDTAKRIAQEWEQYPLRRIDFSGRTDMGIWITGFNYVLNED